MCKRTLVPLFCGLLWCTTMGLPRTVLASEPQFVTIALGTAGGLTEADLSAYLLAPTGSTAFVALDAGTLMTGLQQAHCKGNLAEIVMPPESSLSVEGQVLTQYIKGYLLSHAHLDHVAGLALNSPDDTNKNILGLASTIDTLRDHLFNGKLWPNFADDLAGP
jgi:3',5'-cyclic-nucleotide phosphodiesterase